MRYQGLRADLTLKCFSESGPWIVGGMIEFLESALPQGSLCNSGLVDRGIVVEEQDTACQLAALLLTDALLQPNQFLGVILAIDGPFRRCIVHHQQSLRIPENGAHDLPG